MGFVSRMFNAADEAELTPRERRHLRAEKTHGEGWIKQKGRWALDEGARNQRRSGQTRTPSYKRSQRGNRREW